MNKLMKTIALSLASISLAACSTTTASTGGSKYDYLLDTTDLVKADLDLSNADGVLKDVLDKGVLSVATSPDFPPAEWVEDDGTVYGSEMMLAKYIADTLGVELNIETMDFSSTFAAVDTSKVDMALSGFGWKKDREEAYEISIGYVGDPNSEAGHHTLIVRAEDADKYKELSDFVGTKIVAQANSLQEMYVQDQILDLDPNNTTEYEQVGTLDQAVLSLQSKKCDAIAVTETTGQKYVDSSDGQFAMTYIWFDTSMYGDFQGNIALVKKGETSMIDVVNEILTVVKDNGYYETWYQEAKKQSGIED